MRRRRTISLARTTSPSMSWPPPPPSGESEEERARRHLQEREAKKMSHAIEKELDRERDEQRKRKNHTKVLILGQAESGKSTILKQFQLFYAPRAFQAESEAWRAVIHLNLVRSVNFILDLLSSANSSGDNVSTSPVSMRTMGSRLSGNGSSGGPSLRELRMRLSPLRQVEMILIKRLTGNGDPQVQPPPTRESLILPEIATPWYHGRASEVQVRGQSGWKDILRRGKQMQNREKDDLDDARQILHACREDIAALWASHEVQAELRAEGVILAHQPGFFLDDAERVASLDYEPIFRDVLQARLQTIGVEEHTVVVEEGDHEFQAEVGQTWLFYDVGGSRHQRTAWAPYFDDVNAIIFLCPMSGFNEVLLEDPAVNRLLDSFTLWKTICASKILANVTFVLLLNKYDILQAKLEAGQSFVKWVRSYKNGPNDVEHVSEYLRTKFVAIHKSDSPAKRSLHVHLTCALDVQRMASVIIRIREVIIEANLVESALL